MLEGEGETDHELDLLLLRLPVSASNDAPASADAGRSRQTGGAPTLDLSLALVEPSDSQARVAQCCIARRWAMAALVSIVMWAAVVATILVLS